MMRLALALTALLAGCGETPEWQETPPWVWTDLVIEVAPAFDPKLDGDPQLDIAVHATGFNDTDCVVDVEARHAGGAVVDLGVHAAPTGPAPVVIPWDGRDADGFVLDPGAVQILADLRCSARVQGQGVGQTYLVRLGPRAIDFGIDDDPDKVLLAWHKTSLTERRVQVVPHSVVEWRRDAPAGQLSDLDDDFGEPRADPEPWADGYVPPWGAGAPEDLAELDIPVAYVAGGDFTVAFSPGTHATSASRGIAVDARGPLAGREALPVIRIVSDDLEPLDEPSWSPGRAVRFAGGGLPETIGEHVLPLTWRFEALDDGAWVPIPGELETSHHVWILAGQTRVSDGTAHGASPSATWVGVLHDLAPAIQGLRADDPPAVMDAIRDHLHLDPWIKYNPGDSAYSSFSGRYIYWDRIWSEMSDWLDRQQGIDLYCHSVACLVSSHANHLGIEAEYITIVNKNHPENGARFTTVLVRAAGTDSWRRYTFNSHGIVWLDGRVWDAAVDIDGDDQPTVQPIDPLAPKGLTWEAYAELVTDSDMAIVNRGRCDQY